MKLDSVAFFINLRPIMTSLKTSFRWWLALAAALAALVVAAPTPASAFGVFVEGLPNGGNSIGQYVISGQTYWWLGINYGAVPLDNASEADGQINTFPTAWVAQGINRHIGGPDVLVKQVAVVQYVLDANLPWDTLAGASGRFLEQNGDFHNYTSNDPFLNAMFAAEAFIGQTEANSNQLDFTNLSNYTDPFAGLGDATDDARSALFQSILTDVAAKDAAGAFANYSAQHGYEAVGVPILGGSFMDGLFLASFAPVPEPGSALLLATCALGCVLRRRRVAK